MLPTIGKLLDQSFSLYEKHWRLLVRLGSWVFLVVFINFFTLSIYPIDAARLVRDLTNWEIGSTVLYVLNNVIIGVVIGLWVLNMIVGAIHKLAKGGSVEIAPLARAAWKGFWPQLKTNIASLVVFAIAVAIPTTLIFGFIYLVAPHIPVLLGQIVGVLLLLFYLPALAVLFLTTFASIACVVDGVSGIAALKKSAERIRANASAMLSRMLLPKLLYLALFVVIQHILLQVFSLLIDSVVSEALLSSRLHQMGNLLTYAIPFLFLNPLLLTTDYLLYTHND